MTKPKTALITGITGQDGAYLAQLLLRKGYTVHGVKRRSSQFNTQRVDHLFRDTRAEACRFFLHFGDLTDGMNLISILQQTQPDEIYNLAAQSHVKVSFESPEYTANADGLGTLRLLESIRVLGMAGRVRFYQAGTSEMFGNVGALAPAGLTEQSSFRPRSPYGVAKLYAHWTVVNYREAYGIHAVSGVLFNHESPLRGETFVTRKITRAAARISLGLETGLYVGNLDAQRDWGHARDYVEGMWRIVQHDVPTEFVLATGRTLSVRAFVVMAFAQAGIDLEFLGHGPDEVGRCRKTKAVLVRIDPVYRRPTEIDSLLGDATQARRQLGWAPTVSLEELCREMIEADLYRARQRLGLVPQESPAVEECVHHAGGFLGWLKDHGGLKASA